MMRRKPGSGFEGRCRRGLMLLECLVYLSLWLLVVGLGFRFFYQAYTQSKHLARNADDIARVLKAGEMWRQDVRHSSTVPRWESREGETGRDFVLGAGDGWVAYRCTATNVLRRTSIDPGWRELFGGVETCEFHRDERGPVVSWRWELELKPRVRPASIRPRFTFQTVSARMDQP